jgi:hypothetical protein
MNFEKLALATGWHDAIFQMFGLSFYLNGRLSRVLLISKGDYIPNGWNQANPD